MFSFLTKPPALSMLTLFLNKCVYVNELLNECALPVLALNICAPFIATPTAVLPVVVAFAKSPAVLSPVLVVIVYLTSLSSIILVLSSVGKVPVVWFIILFVVIFKFAPLSTSCTLKPSAVVINVFAFAVAVPVVVSTQLIVLVGLF